MVKSDSPVDRPLTLEKRPTKRRRYLAIGSVAATVPLSGCVVNLEGLFPELFGDEETPDDDGVDAGDYATVDDTGGGRSVRRLTRTGN